MFIHIYLGAISCTPGPNQTCSSNTINVTNLSTYLQTGGPKGNTKYSWIIFIINVIGTFVFTPFLPANIKECHLWKEKGTASDAFPSKTQTGWLSFALATTLLLYGIILSILIMVPQISCKEAFGGSGC